MISPLLQERLSSQEIRRYMDGMAQNPVQWPSGDVRPIKVSTLYRWLRLYKENPTIESLYPKKHACRSTCIKDHWLDYALTMLEEEPDRSLYMLSNFIKYKFGLDEGPSSSSLHRAFYKHPRYIKLCKKKRYRKKKRVRFETTEPHVIWHSDAKGEFDCHFADGLTKKVQTLTILDDASRYVLRSQIVMTESIPEAVATFRQAAARYGLPYKFYADRGSAYDSDCFRTGLAALGVHRINTKPRNPAAHGKIEAWHRTLNMWFVRELKHQLVADMNHLQALLYAFIEELYHTHKHKELKMSPAEAFGEKMSDRPPVSTERLYEAFLIKKTMTTERNTGNIRVKGQSFKVPEDYIPLNRKVPIAIDPEKGGEPLLILKSGKYQPLELAIKKVVVKKPEAISPDKWPEGSLTPLLQKYKNRNLPQAVAGFGLPEIYELFSEILKRKIPNTETESSLIINWLKENGPFEPKSLRAALTRVVDQLGSGRALSQIIEMLNLKIDTKEVE
jgi:transposase InsO family protein